MFVFDTVSVTILTNSVDRILCGSLWTKLIVLKGMG